MKAALSSSTASGTFAQRCFGTATISACGPFDTTRSPGANPSTPVPASETTPTLLYPRGRGWPSLCRTASTVVARPSVRTFWRTSLTLSGCCRALPMNPSLAEIDEHSLCPGREKRAARPDQQPPPSCLRSRHISQFGLSRAQVLQYLLHDCLVPASILVWAGRLRVAISERYISISALASDSQL